uniref:Uncharacterized protein n=1 Tax=Arundo donax TaxID=35708 RepID=A0A0A9HPD1_ARUDO
MMDSEHPGKHFSSTQSGNALSNLLMQFHCLICFSMEMKF